MGGSVDQKQPVVSTESTESIRMKRQRSSSPSDSVASADATDAVVTGTPNEVRKSTVSKVNGGVTKSREWTQDEYTILCLGIEKYGSGNWKSIAALMGNRTPEEIERYATAVANGTVIPPINKRRAITSTVSNPVSRVSSPIPQAPVKKQATDADMLLYQTHFLQQLKHQHNEMLLRRMEEDKQFREMLMLNNSMQNNGNMNSGAMKSEVVRGGNPTMPNNLASLAASQAAARYTPTYFPMMPGPAATSISPPVSPPLQSPPGFTRYPYYSQPSSALPTGVTSSCNTPPEVALENPINRHILANVLNHNLQILAQQQKSLESGNIAGYPSCESELPKAYPNGRPISGAVPGTENTGRWSAEEHEAFLQGLQKYGTRHWTAIANVVKTRTVVQVRTHAQKYFKKLGQGESDAF